MQPTSPKRRSNGALHFVLFVAGSSPNSVRARAVLESLCATEAPGRKVRVEVVDVLQDPGRAMAAEVFVTPTLLRLEPKPEMRLLGDLSDRERARALFAGAPGESSR
jgi:circadian clock protein KaiB